MLTGYAWGGVTGQATRGDLFGRGAVSNGVVLNAGDFCRNGAGFEWRFARKVVKTAKPSPVRTERVDVINLAEDHHVIVSAAEFQYLGRIEGPNCVVSVVWSRSRGDGVIFSRKERVNKEHGVPIRWIHSRRAVAIDYA